MDVANTAMKNMNLPKEAQELVRTYLITTQGTQHEQKQLENFINLISPSLREEVAGHPQKVHDNVKLVHGSIVADGRRDGCRFPGEGPLLVPLKVKRGSV